MILTTKIELKGGDIMNKIKELRKLHKLSQIELANMIPVNQTAISQWERGITTPNPNALKRLCKIFNKSSDYFLEIETEETNTKKGVKIPVFGKVAAGIPIEAIEDIDDYEEIDASWIKDGSEFFALKIQGASMEPKISDGDVVIVRKQETIENGQIAIVTVDGEYATCKKIKKTPEGVILISTNTAYEPMVFTNKEIVELPIRILGRVVELRAKF